LTNKNYFTPQETSCRCGCGLDIRPETRDFANRVREDWTHYLVGLGYEAKAGELLCMSGARCKVHNEKVGGAEASAHVAGLAIDLAPRTTSLMAEFHKFCAIKRPLWNKGKVGMESPKWTPTWCHLQLREPYKVFNP
jgi:hypothetical protein